MFDYMGVPTNVELTVNSLHFRAYNLIWNEWFRDQNLQNSLTENKGNGPDSASIFSLQSRGKRHDYFTSGLPWPQKGDAVDIPLGTRAPINVDNTNVLDTVGVFNDLQGADDEFLVSGGNIIMNSVVQTPGATLYADLTDATAATINQLRQAFQIQKLFERDARGGTCEAVALDY